MRRGLGLLGLVVTIAIVAIVGVIAYQVGWGDGFAQHLPAAVPADGSTTAPAPYYPYYYGYGYGPHFFGFGWIFGLLIFLFLGFIFFRIVAFGLFGWGRGWGYGGRGWGHYRGGVPPAIDERMKEWHRQAHGEQPSGSTPPPPPPAPEQK